MIQNTILDTEYATVWYYPEPKIVHHVFHKFIYGPEFRNVLETGLDAFKKHGAQKWLSDDRKNSALPTEDLQWGTTVWFHQAYDAGWKYWALVMPDKVAGQMNMNRIMKQYIEQGLTIKVFSDPDEALKWLETV
jgi:hypothetical protein